MTDILRDFVYKAVGPDDIVEAKKQNRHCLYFSCNGVPLPQSWVSVEEELRYIELFFQLGCRMMHLTYQRRNMIGDGCGESANAGLSDFGRTVIKEMNRVGVIVDVAHSGQQTSFEAAKLSCLPVVASHSGVAALNNHVRCKSDKVIKAIADSGGFIGICCYPNFLGRSHDIVFMLDHIDYVVKRFGVDHVAIGTDTAYYTSIEMARECKKIPSRAAIAARKRWEDFWPAVTNAVDPRLASMKEKSIAWTNWPVFTIGLVQRGYSDEDIQKIIGGNVMRVIREVWQGRKG